jgi:hypothetical protein
MVYLDKDETFKRNKEQHSCVVPHTVTMSHQAFTHLMSEVLCIRKLLKEETRLA